MTAWEPDNTEPTRPYRAGREVVRGISWAVLMRWSIRGVGLLSTVILARLLTPEDFGVAAMGLLVIGLLYTFSEFGTSMHLIRVRDLDRAHCDTAWTITLLQHVVIAALIFALAPLAASYFSEPRVVPVMQVLAVGSVIGGFSSVSVPLIRREMKFDLDFRFSVYKKLTKFTATVGLAFILRDYWALVYGHVIGTAISVLLSYTIHPYRPRFSLERAGEYMRFAMSILPMRAANQLREMSPKLIVGSLGSSGIMGGFTVSYGLATLFTQEIVQPMGRGLFPNYTRLASDNEKLSNIYRKVLGTVALLALPIGAGVSAVAEDLVAVLLGDQWDIAVPLVKYLAIGGALFAVSHTMFNQILVAVGRERAAAVLAWVRLGVTVPILLAGLWYDGAVGVAMATIVAPLVYLPLTYLETRKAVHLPVRALIGLLWRPVTAAAVMYVVIRMMHPEALDWAALRLVSDIAVGAGTFAATIVAMWLLAGRPDGAESACLDLVKKSVKWRPLGFGS